MNFKEPGGVLPSPAPSPPCADRGEPEGELRVCVLEFEQERDRSRESAVEGWFLERVSGELPLALLSWERHVVGHRWTAG